MDIKTKAVAETGRLQLKDANDDLMDGVFVTVYSPGSKQHAKASAAKSNRLLDKLKSNGKIKQSAQQKAEENAEFLADITVGFDKLQYDDLEGRELALAVYSDTSIGFIADQVAAFVGEWSNFTKASTTN